MCLVEIEGMPKLQTACSTPVRDGMVVYTQTDRVKEAQNAVVEFLLVNHPLDCPVCDKGGECPLQDIAMGWGPGKSRFTDPKRHFQKPLELSPLVAIDRERCILCYRCVRFSQEVAEDEQLQLLERGDKTFVGTFDERPYIAPFHGNIIELCPVGALTSYTYRFRARPWDIEQAGSVCTLCPSQCNVGFTVRDERVLRVNARDNAEVDDGWLCDKGRFAFQMFNSAERITRPMVRAGDGSLSPICWDEAVSRVGEGTWHSPATNAAALVGGGTSNEEGWLVQRILRAGGSSNVDCSPNPVDPALLGELSRPDHGARMADLDHADAILVVGVDPLHEMPILDLRIRKAVRRSPREADGRLGAARPRSTAAPRRRSATRRARRPPSSRALAGALGAEGYDAGGPIRGGGRGDREDPARRPRPGDRLGRAALARSRRGRRPARLLARARHAQADRARPARGPRGVEHPRPARGRLPARRQARAWCPSTAGAAAPRSRTASPRTTSAPSCSSTPTRFAPTRTPTAGGRRWPAASSSRSPPSRTSRPGSPTSSSRPRPTPRRRERSPIPRAASSASAATSRSPTA